MCLGIEWPQLPFSISNVKTPDDQDFCVVRARTMQALERNIHSQGWSTCMPRTLSHPKANFFDDFTSTTLPRRCGHHGTRERWITQRKHRTNDAHLRPLFRPVLVLSSALRRSSTPPTKSLCAVFLPSAKNKGEIGGS